MPSLIFLFLSLIVTLVSLAYSVSVSLKRNKLRKESHHFIQSLEKELELLESLTHRSHIDLNDSELHEFLEINRSGKEEIKNRIFKSLTEHSEYDPFIPHYIFMIKRQLQRETELIRFLN